MNIENGLNFPLNMLETFSYFITSGHRILNLPNWACKFRICKPRLCMINKNNQFVFLLCVEGKPRHLHLSFLNYI